jgi:hypothetical protein
MRRWGDAYRTSRHARGYGSDWDRIRARIVRRDAGICQACKLIGLIHAGDHVDHRLAKAFGGTDADDNLWLICAAEHARKTAGEADAARRGLPAPAYRAGGGGEKAGAAAPRTVRLGAFSLAVETGGGGYPSRAGDQADEAPLSAWEAL